MNTIAEFTIIPIGVGVSLSRYVAACEQILEDSGLSYELHANGTNIEGDWDDVMQAIRTCHERLHEMGVARIATQVKLGTRTDRAQKMREKVESVQRILGKREETYGSDGNAQSGEPERKSEPPQTRISP